MDETRELLFFIRELLNDASVLTELENRLGDEQKNRIINHFNNARKKQELNLDFEDVIEDHIYNESIIHITLIGIGDFGEFPINIMYFGPLFWISAQEFDIVKYFETAEKAIEFAKWEYQSFLQ
jgi:hypothetical protein